MLDAAAAKGTCNFVRDVAYQLPMHIIGDIIGIPEADRPDVFHWTDIIMCGARSGDGHLARRAPRGRDGPLRVRGALGDDKRRNPTDDVWSILTTAEVEDDDGTPTRLTSSELDQFFLILAIAGSETTRSAISGGLVALARPSRPTGPAAVGSRRCSAPPSRRSSGGSTPVACFARTATSDVEVDGQQIRAGDRVSMWFPAANRDPRVFERPDTFDITRDPNPHVSFGGGGAHFCLGAHLARQRDPDDVHRAPRPLPRRRDHGPAVLCWCRHPSRPSP